ncbi:MAG: hypothetical protein ACI9GZ_001058, partial [Bacteroidia bacterium]
DTVKGSLKLPIDLRLFHQLKVRMSFELERRVFPYLPLSQTNPFRLAFFLSLDRTKV